MAKFDKTSFMKELKTWTKPTRGIQFTPFKAAYSIGKLPKSDPRYKALKRKGFVR